MWPEFGPEALADAVRDFARARAPLRRPARRGGRLTDDRPHPAGPRPPRGRAGARRRGRRAARARCPAGSTWRSVSARSCWCWWRWRQTGVVRLPGSLAPLGAAPRPPRRRAHLAGFAGRSSRSTWLGVATVARAGLAAGSAPWAGAGRAWRTTRRARSSWSAAPRPARRRSPSATSTGARCRWPAGCARRAVRRSGSPRRCRSPPCSAACSCRPIPVFDRLVVRSLDFDVGALASHAGQVFLWGWLAAGVLRVLCRSDGIVRPVPGRRGTLGLVEVGIVLAVVDLLFLAFVAVQFRYLFGGDELVRAITGMSYAEYARRGFFELVTVAALSLPLLLLADWSLDQRDPARGRALPLPRAAHAGPARRDARLGALPDAPLYRPSSGSPSSGSIPPPSWAGWCWSSAGSRPRCCAAAASGSAPGRCWRAGWCSRRSTWPIPDAIIVGVNLDRAGQGRPFDVAYAESLSADAIPALHRGLPRLDTADACTAAWRLGEHWRRELEAPQPLDHCAGASAARADRMRSRRGDGRARRR